ncbi:hypothetical protein GG496_000511 [Candidatus Fervidibacteria bacterium JGI MDM2 JNZ-1-D12]
MTHFVAKIGLPEVFPPKRIFGSPGGSPSQSAHREIRPPSVHSGGSCSCTTVFSVSGGLCSCTTEKSAHHKFALQIDKLFGSLGSSPSQSAHREIRPPSVHSGGSCSCTTVFSVSGGLCSCTTEKSAHHKFALQIDKLFGSLGSSPSQSAHREIRPPSVHSGGSCSCTTVFLVSGRLCSRTTEKSAHYKFALQINKLFGSLGSSPSSF